MKIEILHVRDPDYACSLRVFVDDVEVNEFDLEDVDPGAGYPRADWDERIEEARHEDPTPFQAAVHQALVDNAGNQYISDDGPRGV